jgi:hypothetical protein
MCRTLKPTLEWEASICQRLAAEVEVFVAEVGVAERVMVGAFLVVALFAQRNLMHKT